MTQQETTPGDLQGDVIVASKGRPDQVRTLLRHLAEQSAPPRTIVVIGSEPADVAGIEDAPNIKVLISDQAGSCVQRNLGLEWLSAQSDGARDGFVAFFDDDFRPHRDWLLACAQGFSRYPEAVAITGHVLADGVRSEPIREDEAEAYLSGAIAPQEHWASGAVVRDLDGMYGCNMAFRWVAAASCRFDELLPLYAWQEDWDYTTLAKAFGRTIFYPDCKGVHLGARSGRTSGVRLGYSQIVNPRYLAKKGTMSGRSAIQKIARNLASNFVYTVLLRQQFDYPGRLRGNALALVDIATGRAHPGRILEL